VVIKRFFYGRELFLIHVETVLVTAILAKWSGLPGVCTKLGANAIIALRCHKLSGRFEEF
jgi:hypothetical protein